MEKVVYSPACTLSLERRMQAALTGDGIAYDSVLQEIRQKLRVYLSRKLPPHDRDDVIQNILLSIHKARATWDGGRPLMPWVMAIARFRLNDHWRRQYGHAFKESVDLEDMKNILAIDGTETLNVREDIRRIMNILSPKQQKILQLMYRQDQSVQEVAAQLQMTVSAVKVAAHRGYKIFRKRMV